VVSKKNSPSGTKAKSSRRTVASLGKEVVELRAEVAELRESLAAWRAAQKPSAPVQVPASVDIPAPVVAVAAAAVVKPVARSAATAPPPAADAVAEDRGNDPVAELRAFLVEMFRLALVPLPEDEDDREELFGRFISMMHSDRRGTAMLNQNILSYVWDPFRRRVAMYLKDAGDPGSFTVTRMHPDELDANADHVKLFIKARARMPTPISVRRDAKLDNAWRLESSSL